MIQPTITVENRIGDGYLSTIFYDSGTLPVIFRKWIFGDGVVIEGGEMAVVPHTYYIPGIYDVILVAQTENQQYTDIQEGLIIVNEKKHEPLFVIAQSFDLASGKYWRFYFDSLLYLIFEDEEKVYRSRYRVAEINKWTFVEFHRHTHKMYAGNFSSPRLELEVVTLDNTSPVVVGSSMLQVLADSTMKIDELKVWAVEKDVSDSYVICRGKAGYLDNFI